MPTQGSLPLQDSGNLWADWLDWRTYLFEELCYPPSQVDTPPKSKCITLFRDSAQNHCLAIISRQMPGSKPLDRLSDQARKMRAELLILGDPTSYEVHLVGPFSSHKAEGARLPSWIPGLRKNGSRISKAHFLLPFRDEDHIRKALSACHNAIFAGTAKDPAASFDILALVLAAKVLDETCNKPYYEFVQIPRQSPKETLTKFKELVSEASKWILDEQNEATVQILGAISFEIVKVILRELQDYSLTFTSNTAVGTDILGVAYERMVGATFRGELGSYFTPRNVADFMVRLLDTKEGLIFDPSLGSGGLLIAASRFSKEAGKGKGNINIFGNDLNPRMVLAARINFLIHGFDPGNVSHGDGLQVDRMLESLCSFRYQRHTDLLLDRGPGPFDCVLANPPFAGRETNPEVLGNIATAQSTGKGRRSLHRTIPFMEIIVACLKEGGKAGIVLPTSILNAEETSFTTFRDILLQYAEIIAVVGLPEKAFVHTDCGVHGALLFLRRTSSPRLNYDVFVGWVENLGYDRLGKPTEQNDFPKLLDRFHNGNWLDLERVPISRFRESQRWDPAWFRVACSLPQAAEEQFVHLSDLVEIRNARWSRRQINMDSTYRFFEVADADIHTGHVKRIRVESGFELAKKGRIKNKVKAGDLLLPNHRDSLKAASAENGRSVVVVDDSLDGVLTTDRFLVLRAKIDPRLAVVIMNSKPVRDQLVAHCRGAASLDIREHILQKVLVPKGLLKEGAASKAIKLHDQIEARRKELRTITESLSELIEAAFKAGVGSQTQRLL